mmetsp:Transcript_5691/g.10797  ORF Transcript_5691/g.10797 Transcript_5691/m.10797 type:complete len:109 (-) Transcript_5691:142-468(-)
MQNRVMVKVKASRINADSIAPRCIKYLKPVQNKKSIELDSIGDRRNNALLDLIRCQVKADKSKCRNESKRYESCHASVMGVGNYEGKKHCGGELEILYKCTMLSNQNP